MTRKTRRAIQGFQADVGMLQGVAAAARARPAHVRRLLDTAYEALFGLGTQEVAACGRARLEGLLSRPLPSTEPLLPLVHLLRVQADIAAAAQQRERAFACAYTGLTLLRKLAAEGRPPDAGLAAALADRLWSSGLPPSLCVELAEVYERIGCYARAEDLVFEGLQSREDGAEETVLPYALMFYRRLLLTPSEELAAGDLPRDEVATGFRQVLERAARARPPARAVQVGA